jgi:hypothetical protein
VRTCSVEITTRVVALAAGRRASSHIGGVDASLKS